MIKKNRYREKTTKKGELMKRFIFYLFTLLLISSCADSGLDSMEAPDSETSVTADSAVSPDARDRCRPFRPNYVLGARHSYQLEVLESNSDFINHIYLVYGSTSTFLATDDDTGTVVNLPPTKPGKELIFEIRVHDPDGNPTGEVWQSGPGSRNVDGAVHALVDRCNRNQYIVRFEDIHSSGWGTGDEPNYVDAVFRLY